MQLFKPNAKGQGHAVGISFNSKDGKIFFKFIKQTGWDEKTKRGKFQGGQMFNITFNATEVGGILNCIERGSTDKLFHSSGKGDTSIEWAPLVNKATNVKNGVTVSVNPRGQEVKEGEKPLQFGFWFNNAEARLLKEYLQFALDHIFTAEYSAEKKKFQEAQSKATDTTEL